MKPQIESIIQKSILKILQRFEQNGPDYPYVDTKFNIVTNRDFGPADEPFRQKDCIYSWIQGRGIESLAKHILYFQKKNNREVAARLEKMLLAVTEQMEKMRSLNHGRLPFAMHQDASPFFPPESPHANFSDLFYSKGLFAAARLLHRPDWEKEAESLFLFVLQDIDQDLFHTDQQCFDPKNRVSFTPGKFPQGPRMISLGGIADWLAANPSDNQWADQAEKSIRFILEHHVNQGQAPQCQPLDFIESLDANHKPWFDPDSLFCDPGHALEFIGLASKCLLILKQQNKKPELITEAGAILPKLFVHIFDLGFHQTAGGICKGYNLLARQATNSDMPWWNLPETVRAGMELIRLFPNAEAEKILLRTGRAFQAFVQGFLQPNGFGCQTRNAQGQIIDVIPAVSDADPGYHTNLSFIDVLALL